MIELTETTVAVVVALLGVVGSFIWHALVRYGIRTLRDVHPYLRQSYPHGTLP